MKTPQQMDIPGTGGKYFVTIDGKVFRRRGEKAPSPLKLRYVGGRHAYKIYYRPGEPKTVYVSIIMKQTYFKNVPKDWCLYHKNSMSSDYAVWNLKPMPRSEFAALVSRSRTAKIVLKIDPNTGEVLEHYPSARAAGRANFVDHHAILRCCRKQCKRFGGTAPDGYLYRWEE